MLRSLVGSEMCIRDSISRLLAYNKMAYSAPLKLVMEIGTVFVTGYAG